MAKQTIVRLIDDLDQSEATRTIEFAWNGIAYEIDLNAKNARAFEQAIEPYVTAARRAGRPAARAGAARRGGAGRLDLAAVRAWAIENGHRVAERGRVPGPVLEAFHAAQHAVADIGGTGRPTPAPAKKAPAKAAKRAPAKASSTSAKAGSTSAKAARKAPAKRVAAQAGQRPRREVAAKK